MININQKNYQKSVFVNSSKQLIFKALTEEVDKWWSDIENSSKNKDDIFKISFGKESYWKFRVIEINKNKRIVWKCIESHQDHNLKGVDEEWLNSEITWTISEKDKNTKIDFLHKGLVTDGICYDVCSTAWDFYILNSLKSYLETGIGKAGQN